MRALALAALLVALYGCVPGLDRQETVTEQRVVPCPETPPPGECPEWAPVHQPADMLICTNDCLEGAKVLDRCREWTEKWMAGWNQCAVQLKILNQ